MKLNCGCKFHVIQQDPLRFELDFKLRNLPLECEKTWNLISSGNTLGCFQIDSRLGRMLSARLKPRNINHLSALVALMRPGPLEGKIDGKTITNRYIDRKNGEEPVDYFHPALEPILQNTYGMLVFQEQSIKIATEIGGLSLADADYYIRKGIGKKDVDIIAKGEKVFFDGAVAKGIVTLEEAKEIWGWIKKCVRYQFNESHSLSYAMTTYTTAYAKAHFTRAFMTSYLRRSHDKPKPLEEVYQLAQNCKTHEIKLCLPDLRKKVRDENGKILSHFQLIDKQIYFGIADIKSIGDKEAEKIWALFNGVDMDSLTWSEFLMNYAPKIKKTAVENMISAGALDFMDISRSKMLFEYGIRSKISDHEDKFLAKQGEKLDSLEDALILLVESPTGKAGGCYNAGRVEKVKNLLRSLRKPPYGLDDSIIWLAQIEAQLLGTPISFSMVDSCDTSQANCSCQDFVEGFTSKVINIAGSIEEVKEHTIKNGQKRGEKMGFLSISDSTGILDSIVIFTDEWEQFKHVLYVDNTIMVSGKRSNRKDGLVVDKIWQI